MRPPRIERRIAPGQLAPGNPSEAGNNGWAHQREFRGEMAPTIRNFASVRIAIAPARVARITADQICDENSVKARTANHAAQQNA